MDLIDWGACDTCKTKTNGIGALHMSYRDMRAAEEAKKAWERRDRLAGTQFARASYEPDELMAPPPALWKVECNACAGRCEGSYWIDLERVQTIEALAWWTNHLRDKSWFGATDWLMVIASVAENGVRASV